MVNVELTTDGLFFTLGNMMPPLRDNGFVALCGMAFDWIVLAGNALAPLFGGVVLVEDVADDGEGGADEDDENVVVGSGGSVNSSIKEYLEWKASY